MATWDCRIAVNQAISVIRGRRATVGLEHAVAAAGRPPDLETAAAVREGVLSLPVNLRAVVVLREYEDLSYRSIAEALAIPVGTVMSRLHESRRRLREQLRPVLRPAAGE